MNHTAEFDNSIHKWRDDVLHNGNRYTGTNAIGNLCRELNNGTLNIYRDGVLCMVIDVEKRKQYDLSEEDKKGFVRRKHN